MSSAHSNSGQPADLTPGPISGRPVMAAWGVPAIVPHLNASDASLPAFTTDEAAAYALSHNGFVLSKQDPGTVVRVQLMTDAEVSQQFHGADPGLASTALVCLVEVHGRFGPPPGSRPGSIYTITYEVFDARTGNLMMMRVGGLET